MKELFAPLILILLWSFQSEKEVLKFESPSGNLKVVVTNDQGKVFYRLLTKTDTGELVVVAPSPLGLIRNDGDFTENLSFVKRTETKTVSDSYSMVSGKQKELSYMAKEVTVVFENGNGQHIEMVFRLFDEGLAFRYSFTGESESKVWVEFENTGFAIPEEINGWMSSYQPAQPWGDPGYESDYISVKSGTPSTEKEGWSFPLLFNTGKNWIYISEAGLDENYCGTHLNQNCSEGLYTIALPESDERLGDGNIHPSSSLPWTMPWRFVLVGQSLDPIVESSMVHHLAEPSKIENTSWIKPGRASWEWWSSRGGRSVKALNHFVDLAAEMGWEYSLVDAGWDDMQDGTIEEVVDYAENKNVGLFFWYNSGGRRDSAVRNEDFVLFNDDTRAKEFARIAALGVKGVKVDFFATDKQIAIELYHKILTDAAKNQLLVNFHGSTLPRGWSRTWPNLLTMEAVRGAEAYRFSESYPNYSATYNTIAAVIRGAAGPTDFTPATFSNQKFAHKTTAAHELALTLVYETGLLHLADTPESYRSLPTEVIKFLKEVPVVWDETKLLAAVPGELFVVARRTGENWYIAGINGKDEAQEVQLELPETIINSTLFSDGQTPTDFSIKKQEGTTNSVSVSMLPYGGFVMH